MNADEIRFIFGYHFAANRAMWEAAIVPLSEEQFAQVIPYSHESVRNQVLHILSVDEAWFHGIDSPERLPFRDPTQYPTKAAVRTAWDEVEARMRSALSALTDERANAPYQTAVPNATWQILMHVLNHGTDHRAQIYAMLNMIGMHSQPQDMLHYYMGRLAGTLSKPG